MPFTEYQFWDRLLVDRRGDVRVGVPTMFAAAPIRDVHNEIVAVLALGIDPDLDFTRILSASRIGDTGETYAFDSTGLSLSPSRFDMLLKKVGLIPEGEGSSAFLNLTLKDPGTDLIAGRHSNAPRSELPLIRPVSDAVAGKSGFDVRGYRDYRGVLVIGAWTWLPERGFGVTTQMDVSEGFRVLRDLRATIWGLVGLLSIAGVTIFSHQVWRTRRRSQRVLNEPKQNAVADRR